MFIFIGRYLCGVKKSIMSNIALFLLFAAAICLSVKQGNLFLTELSCAAVIMAGALTLQSLSPEPPKVKSSSHAGGALQGPSQEQFETRNTVPEALVCMDNHAI